MATTTAVRYDRQQQSSSDDLTSRLTFTYLQGCLTSSTIDTKRAIVQLCRVHFLHPRSTPDPYRQGSFIYIRPCLWHTIFTTTYLWLERTITCREIRWRVNTYIHLQHYSMFLKHSCSLVSMQPFWHMGKRYNNHHPFLFYWHVLIVKQDQAKHIAWELPLMAIPALKTNKVL